MSLTKVRKIVTTCLIVESGVDAAMYTHTHDVFLRRSRALATDFLPAVCESFSADHDIIRWNAMSIRRVQEVGSRLQMQHLGNRSKFYFKHIIITSSALLILSSCSS